MIPDETPEQCDLTALKSAAETFRREKVVLDARAKELDDLDTELGAERINLGGQKMALESVRAVIMKERDKGSQAKSALKRDAAVLQSDRLALAAEENRVHEAMRDLEERDRVLREDEERLEQRSLELSSRTEALRAKLQTLGNREDRLVRRERELDETAARVTALGDAIELRERRLTEREEEFTRQESECLAALDAHEGELVAFRDAVSAVEAEAAQRMESYAAMEAALQEEMDRIVIARTSAAAEKDRLIEVQAILEDTVEPETVEPEAAVPSTEVPAPGDPALAGPPDPAPLALETSQGLETVAAGPVAEPAEESSATMEGAMGRLAQAVKAWKLAQSAGWDVSGLAGPAKSARHALASGDYEGAMRLATTMLDRLRVAPIP